MPVAVIRNQRELLAIQSLVGSNGNKSPTCSRRILILPTPHPLPTVNVHFGGSNYCPSTCDEKNIYWEDGGPLFDESIYDGSWMGMNLDQPFEGFSCLQVISLPRSSIPEIEKKIPKKVWYGHGIPKIDDLGCAAQVATVCMANCPTGVGREYKQETRTKRKHWSPPPLGCGAVPEPGALAALDVSSSRDATLA